MFFTLFEESTAKRCVGRGKI